MGCSVGRTTMGIGNKKLGMLQYVALAWRDAHGCREPGNRTEKGELVGRPRMKTSAGERLPPICRAFLKVWNPAIGKSRRVGCYPLLTKGHHRQSPFHSHSHIISSSPQSGDAFLARRTGNEKTLSFLFAARHPACIRLGFSRTSGSHEWVRRNLEVEHSEI